MSKFKLDRFDQKLLKVVQADTRRTAQELAGEVGLSPSACLRRLKRMRDEGIIEAEVAIIHPAAIGYQLTILIEVSLERERPDIISDFKKAIRATPEIMQCYYVTGEVDFVLVVAMQDMQAYEKFTHSLLFANKNIRRFNTLVVMDRVKVGFSLPIESDV
ncbi:MAG: Lrp/AsnC family transcriptional regulator [Amaricoccus sp.]|uniref:Lrp/AsnC family transcriptional regulator n=1 Tax=Amaricoccus sp. TaxID=1872485 RepID=UPI0039E51F11